MNLFKHCCAVRINANSGVWEAQSPVKTDPNDLLDWVNKQESNHSGKDASARYILLTYSGEIEVIPAVLKIVHTDTPERPDRSHVSDVMDHTNDTMSVPSMPKSALDIRRQDRLLNHTI